MSNPPTPEQVEREAVRRHAILLSSRGYIGPSSFQQLTQDEQEGWRTLAREVLRLKRKAGE